MLGPCHWPMIDEFSGSTVSGPTLGEAVAPQPGTARDHTGCDHVHKSLRATDLPCADQGLDGGTVAVTRYRYVPFCMKTIVCVDHQRATASFPLGLALCDERWSHRAGSSRSRPCGGSRCLANRGRNSRPATSNMTYRP